MFLRLVHVMFVAIIHSFALFHNISSCEYIQFFLCYSFLPIMEKAAGIIPDCALLFYLFLKMFFLLFNYSCPHFPLFPPALPTFSPAPTRCPCPWVLYTYSLTWHLPLFSLLSPSPLPSGHDQFILYFHVSDSILLTLFCSFGSTDRWDHMVFGFHHLAYFI